MDISPVRLVPSRSTVPSLKERAAFAALSHSQNEPKTPTKSASQRARAMLLSPPIPQNPTASQEPSPTAFLISRNHDSTLDKPRSLLQPSLKSPFRPSNLKSTGLSIIRRPSEGTALRRLAEPKETHRRPSDSYANVRKPRPYSFMRNFAPSANTRLTRDPSLLDALQKSVPKTQPNLFPLKSPSVVPSSEVGEIAPIPRIMMQIDTPSGDAEQLVTDMSQFSLVPHPDEIMSSPVKKATSQMNNNVVDMMIDEEEVQHQPQITQSSPGIEIPSAQDDSWCLPVVSHSSPIKSIVASSSDPLDLFHPIRFPRTSQPPRADGRIGGRVNKSTMQDADENSFGGRSFRRQRIYGKHRGRKSVHFANNGESVHHDTDMSEDELLLK